MLALIRYGAETVILREFRHLGLDHESTEQKLIAILRVLALNVAGNLLPDCNAPADYLIVMLWLVT